MVDEIKDLKAAENLANEGLINTAWVERLIEQEVYEGDPRSWMVTESNYQHVLRAINVNVHQFEQALTRAIQASGDQLPYADFCQLYQKELIKAAAFEIRAMDDTNLLETPAQKIISLLREIQRKYLAKGSEPQLVERINYAIDKIGQRTIFDIDYPLLDSLDLALQRRPSLTKGWLNEFSKMGLELLRETSLNAHINQMKMRKKNSTDTMSHKSHAPSLNTIHDYIDENRRHLADADQISFNTLKFCRDLGRKAALSVMTFHIMQVLNLDKLPLLNQTKLSHFLGQIYKGYRRDVEYHNEMHALDVLQMSYVFLTQGGVLLWAQLSELDTLSVLMSAICHDFGHDGFTNAYHVNLISDRAIRFSDQSVQENFHASESFAILNNIDFNFLEDFSRDDFKTFRQRFIGIILATDMARHTSDLAKMKTIIEQKKIEQGRGRELFIDRDSHKKDFDSKQQLLEFCVHAADVSTQTRSFDIAIEWTQLLFEEFFHQGDIEKEKGLPVSFLCDRETTQISQSQPGFVNFILAPLFAQVSTIMPELKQLETNAHANSEQWKTYVETDSFKKVYVRKT